MNLTTTRPLTVDDLEAQGFSTGEIARLRRLKRCYHPYRAFCATNPEFEQLAFLKWRYEQGRIARG
jgi:hypothetical protein